MKNLYVPEHADLDPRIYEEFLKISQAFYAIAETQLPLETREPESPRDGLLVRPDGVNWDPLSLGTSYVVIWSQLAGAWQLLAGGGAGSDHGALTGLGDDDHTQYLNNARGDARYYGLAQGGDLEGEVQNAIDSITGLQDDAIEAAEGIAALQVDVGSLDTLTAQHETDIADLLTTYGSTASAAASATAAAAAESAAIAAQAAAVIAQAGAEAAKDDAVTAQVSAEAAKDDAETAASASATSAVSAAAAATDSESAATASETSRIAAEAAAVNAANAAQGGVTIDAAPGALWQFETDLESWTSSNPTATWDAGQFMTQTAGSDPHLTSPAITVDGAAYKEIVLRLRRTTGTGWEGRIRYSTSGHGYSGTYEVVLTEPLLVNGEFQIVTWDFSGISDWNTSTITGIEIQLGSNGGSADYDIDWIGVGNNIASLASAAAASAAEAASYASTASTAATAASGSATTASTQAGNAATSAAAAATSASTASAASTAAGSSASAADASKVAAQTAESGASTSATNAATSATNAAGSASTASTQATNAANSASAASGSATSASNSANTATTQANNAAVSASAAQASQVSASTQATNAANSATSAATQATNAAASSTSAGGSATAAAASATQANTSAGNASTSATQASTSANNAVNAAVTASTHAATAQGAAVTATTQASNATSSATSASNSAALAAQYRNAIVTVNPLTRLGDVSGWSGLTNVVNVNYHGRLVSAGYVTNSGDVQAYSDLFEIDPTGIYEVRLSVTKETAAGQIYVGAWAEPSSAQLTRIKNQVVTGNSNNEYFFAVNPQPGVWYDLVTYVLGYAANAAQCPNALWNGSSAAVAGQFVDTDGLKLPSGATQMRLRVLNWQNPSNVTMAVRNVTITRLDNQSTALLKQEATVRAAGDNANASAISSLSTTVGSNTSSITSQQTSINGLLSRYTVKIDNNGYVSGFGLASESNNGAVVSAFTVLADRFSIVIPGATPITPFTVGLVNGVSTVGINGNLVVDGSILARNIQKGAITTLQNAPITPLQVLINNQGGTNTWQNLGYLKEIAITVNNASAEATADIIQVMFSFRLNWHIQDVFTVGNEAWAVIPHQYRIYAWAEENPSVVYEKTLDYFAPPIGYGSETIIGFITDFPLFTGRVHYALAMEVYVPSAWGPYTSVVYTLSIEQIKLNVLRWTR